VATFADPYQEVPLKLDFIQIQQIFAKNNSTKFNSSGLLGLIWHLSSTCSLDVRQKTIEINSWYLRMNEKNHIISIQL